MKKSGALLWMVVFCLLLAACGRGGQEPQEGEDPPAEEVVQPPREDGAEEEPPQGGEAGRQLNIGHLTVELVADWGESDRLLSEMEELSLLLQTGLREQNCEVGEITVTLSTAGGFTSNALAEGGVDAAWMPAVDYISCEDAAYAVLTTDEELCTTVLAVSASREELDGDFRAALSAALLETEAGAEFLGRYCPGLTFLPADGAALDAVREWLAAQEEAAHGA